MVIPNLGTPTFISQNNNVEETSNTNSVAVPTGTVPNDLMVAWIAVEGHSEADPMIEPTGWTRFSSHSVDGSDLFSMHGYWKAAESLEQPTTFQVKNGETPYFILSVETWRGVDVTAPSSSNLLAEEHEIGGLITVENPVGRSDRMAFVAVHFEQSGQTLTGCTYDGVSMTEVGSASRDSNGMVVYVLGEDEFPATYGDINIEAQFAVASGGDSQIHCYIWDGITSTATASGNDDTGPDIEVPITTTGPGDLVLSFVGIGNQVTWSTSYGTQSDWLGDSSSGSAGTYDFDTGAAGEQAISWGGSNANRSVGVSVRAGQRTPVRGLGTDGAVTTTGPIDVYLPAVTTTADDGAASAFLTQWNYTGGGLGGIPDWTSTSLFDTGYSAVYRRDLDTPGTYPEVDSGSPDIDMWLSGVVAFAPWPGIVAADDFDRPDGPRGPNWTGVGRYGAIGRIVGNVLKASELGNSYDGNTWRQPMVGQAAPNGDNWIEVDCLTDGTEDGYALCIGMDDADSWPAADQPDNYVWAAPIVLFKYRWNANARLAYEGSEVATYGVGTDVSFNARLAIEGNDAVAYIDGVERMRYTFSRGTEVPLGRYVGLVTKGGDFDNFRASNLPWSAGGTSGWTAGEVRQWESVAWEPQVMKTWNGTTWAAAEVKSYKSSP